MRLTLPNYTPFLPTADWQRTPPARGRLWQTCLPTPRAECGRLVCRSLPWQSSLPESALADSMGGPSKKATRPLSPRSYCPPTTHSTAAPDLALRLRIVLVIERVCHGRQGADILGNRGNVRESNPGVLCARWSPTRCGPPTAGGYGAEAPFVAVAVSWWLAPASRAVRRVVAADATLSGRDDGDASRTKASAAHRSLHQSRNRAQ